MLVSVVIPAYNEENYLPATIASIRQSFDALPHKKYEIIVADDASTDRTADLAGELGARVVYSGKRNIGATRNIGANEAKGEVILFFDADSLLNPNTLKAMFHALDEGYIGGGTLIHWDRKVPFSAWMGSTIWNGLSRLFRWPAGSFFFVRKDIFSQSGGFDEEYYASEELHLAKSLKKYGKLKILDTPIQTSPRKIDDYPMSYVLLFFFKSAFAPIRTLKDRSKLDMWYKHR